MYTEIFIGLLTTVLTTLVGWAVAKLTALLDVKIKDKKALSFITNATNIVLDAVKSTYQTYVENVKGTELWDVEAQKKALSMAKEKALAELNEGTKKYIQENYGDINEWLENKIESSLYTLKTKSE